MKNFIIKYQAIIGFVLGILATLATQTTTQVDDKAVAAAQEIVAQYVSETTVVPLDPQTLQPITE